MVGELGFLGALVNPTDAPTGGRRYLDDAACGPLLAAAAARGRPLFVHPSRELPAGEHFDDFVLSLIVGRPTQTAVCAARLIFTGTLDRHPRLPLLLAHGGGVLPAMAGRLDATWRAYRPGPMAGPGRALVAPVHVSAPLPRRHQRVVGPALRLLLDVLGPERLLVGNDQPPVWFPLGESLRAARPARAGRGRSRGDPLGQRRAALRDRRAAGRRRAGMSELPRPVADLCAALGSQRGVLAVALGGSRASGTADAASDWDLGLYYRGEIDLTVLARHGEVHPPGSWGRLMNGGAWLTVDGLKVDVMLRDLDVVGHWSAEAAQGRYEVDALLGYVAGAPTYGLMASWR